MKYGGGGGEGRKLFGKRERFRIGLKENNGEPFAVEWRILRICKTGVVPTLILVLIVRDSVITLSEIAYNVTNTLD